MARGVALLAATLALTLGGASAARADTPAPGASLGLGRPHSIGWDKYSLKIDGNRLVVWSGEFHYFRLPSPSLWPDVLQKIKADGFNTVQLYFSWAYHSPKQGVYDFSGIRDIDKLLDDAQDAGLYVLARPGPYINAETDAGGLPDWILADNPLRTDAPCTDACPGYGSYLSQAEDWLHHVDAIIARHQLTTGGGSVIGYQIENELQESGTDQYMADLAAQVRSDGITVPLYFNDPGIAGRFVPSDAGGSGGDRAPWNDLYGYDDYPNGFSCTNPTQWSPAPDRESAFRAFDTNTPIFSPEFQGGSIDLWGGSGYDNCRAMTGPDFERVFEQTNFANGLTMESNYMTYGGTSWGGLPSPTIVYTSYDYGAAITEGRQLTAKYGAQKEIGYFLGSVAPLAQTDAAPRGTATNVSPPDATPCANGTAANAASLTGCGAIKVYHRVNPTTNTSFFFVRHDESRSTVDSTFNVPISTPDGSYTVPQNGTLELNGRDMKTIVADDDLDTAARPQHLVYSTSNLMTDRTINGQDVVLVWAPKGQSGETALRYTSQPAVTPLSGTAPTTHWNAATGDLVIDATHNGLSVVRISGGGATQPLLLLLADDPTAQGFWLQDTPAGSVLDSGPELVRSANVEGETLALRGDTDEATTLTVWAPSGVRAVTWNGQPVAMSANPDGSLTSTTQLTGPPSVTLPDLTGWTYRHENPEADPGFDDSGWKAADHTTTNNPNKPPAGQPVLYADDYGFHHGAVWYRGHFTPTAPLTTIAVNPGIGGPGYATVWLNGTYLGTGTGNKTYTLPPGAVNLGADNVLSVLISNVGHDQIVHYQGFIVLGPNTPRGLVSVTTTPATPIAWKIQGNQGGEDIADTARGPLNNGGLFGERAGWSLPGFDATGWTPVSLPNSDPTPGVAWYRTTFNLNEPRGVDASIGLNIADAATRQYRAVIFLNGWNLGLYANDVGPQHTFVLPNGLLHTGIDDDGKNTLAIAVLTPNAGGGPTGGGLGHVSLTDTGPDLGVVQGGVPVRDVPVASTSTSGTVGGTVPATLALTLGSPPSFGAFAPGVDKDYTASTMANVTSTAGDATLSVSDPSPQAPGHLVNGSFALPQPLQVSATSPAGTGSAFAPVSATPITLLTYGGPLSNDPVAITFKQTIAKTDPLRTGNYSKTLTFTLSTTNP